MSTFNINEQLYLDALFFTQNSPDFGEEYNLSEKDINDFSEAAIKQIHEDIEKFTKLTQETKSVNNPENSLFDEYSYDDQFWYDFWFTRNRHGVGFWETPDYPKEDGELLTVIAESFCEVMAYIDEDGKIQLEQN